MSFIYGVSILFWAMIMVFLMAIGGFFMFRKFLRSMPKADGKSDLDWQDYYIDQTRKLWSDDGLALLNELVSPVPELFRDVARRSIAAKIGKLALDERASAITLDLIVRGYILATPKRDHQWLKSHLETKQIDYSLYQHLFG